MDEKKINEIGHQLTLDEWSFIRDDIKRRLAESVTNFVGIGFRLKQLKETEIFDGCKDIFEFAQREYGMSKSGVYRFMAINTKYSEGGNSLLLREEFKNFSISKLDEMLALPDSEIEMITEDTTISQIRELKDFNKQEEEAPAAGLAISASENSFVNCIIDYFQGRKEALNEILKEFYAGIESAEGKLSDDQITKIADIVNPSGNTSHKYGKVFMFLYDADTGIKYKTLGDGRVVKLSWKEFAEIVADIYGEDVWTTDNPYETYYGKEEPEVVESDSIETESASEEVEKVEGEVVEGDNDELEERNPESEEKPSETVQNVQEDKEIQGNPSNDEDTEEADEEDKEECEEVTEDEQRLNHRLFDLANICGQVKVEKTSISQLDYLVMTMDMTLRQLKTYIEIKKEENK